MTPVADDLVASYVETRGSALPDDYKFLGAGPARAWWYQDYRDWTTFDHPTVLVEGDGHGWRLYVGAIPSSRHDPTGSTNRVAVVAESGGGASGGADGAADGAADVDPEALVRLVEAWLGDVAEQREPGRVRDALDAAFSGEVVDRLYAGGSVEDVRARLRAACVGLGEPTAGPPDVPGSWIAPVHGGAGRSAFVARVRAILRGESSGSAIFVNLVDRAADFPRAPGDPPLAVLVTDPEGALALDPQALPTADPPKKAHRPIATSASASGPNRTRRLLALALLLAVVGLVWWLTQMWITTGTVSVLLPRSVPTP